MEQKWILATNNAHKVQEFQRILAPLGICVVSQKELGLSLEVEETADTFAGNSLLKAQAAFEASGLPAVADDSGLEVYALGMRPGVYSARYGGEGLSDRQRYELLLQEMAGVPREKRQARFVACISLVFSAEKYYSFTGICEGEIGFAPQGENGFGYDPIFLVGDRSFSQLSPQEKDQVSHRGRALRQMTDFLTAETEKMV